MNEQFVTIKKAAEILGVTPLTLRNWDKSGKFPTTRHPMNNYRVYKVSDLMKIAEDLEFNKNTTNKRNEARKLPIRHLDYEN
ncbi:MAG: MerR family DNA-binding transcriptional regulator [Candidatus Zambryskibacteria bacterium CG10_big_fil_rev_8_21_14_0_10_42_12]|uniref:MerR family DNA-binding transcriptional regulator n=1 Tax=Candidatus Zambryskibacteria bacterium CG10_big_fil_rev_8_21_14_0_10_42_12 TaxID=1975115 RepID=A0A2H0QVV1_9BACT|nr:MAG: MerR family DNA-binding transcriptional regulator [Candidatus Zambryskibacteria bacterium CG10_big_fil_rev_8_21_14_0_10_42_12]